MSTEYQDITAQLLEAALSHVPFDGWSEATVRAAIAETGVDPTLAKAVFPRGGVDLALAYHTAGDAEMLDALKATDLSALRFRDRIAAAIRFRVNAIKDKEVLRRSSALLSLPHHAADGVKAIWGTADKIWTALGDTSEDVNWYTKRATVSGVYASTTLYWLGDESAEYEATWAFLDRRIDDAMQIEKVKAQVRESRFLSQLMAGPNWLLSGIKAPIRTPDLPGYWDQQSS